MSKEKKQKQQQNLFVVKIITRALFCSIHHIQPSASLLFKLPFEQSEVLKKQLHSSVFETVDIIRKH